MILYFQLSVIIKFIAETLAKLTDESLGVEELFDLTMATGEYGLKAMALLDQANTESYGNPEMTEVNIGVSDRPGILISGHDLNDMENLLKSWWEQREDFETFHGPILFTTNCIVPSWPAANYQNKIIYYKFYRLSRLN